MCALTNQTWKESSWLAMILSRQSSAAPAESRSLIKPLARGGTNQRTNLQLLCPPCNLSKSAKDPIDFMQSRGFLL